MRLSLLKAAHVAVASAAYQEIRVAHLVRPVYAKVREHGAPVQGARLVSKRDLSHNQRMTLTSAGVAKPGCSLGTYLYGPSGYARDDKVGVCASMQCCR